MASAGDPLQARMLQALTAENFFEAALVKLEVNLVVHVFIMNLNPVEAEGGNRELWKCNYSLQQMDARRLSLEPTLFNLQSQKIDAIRKNNFQSALVAHNSVDYTCMGALVAYNY